ncbi:hypothetical protein [Novosphingobium sp. 9]|uniref:hypothetical protein n=1 Tax=Novosphingobium sp. 9 TaxID=2025349 RepID=UPI0021B4FA59|nr:hypothetical protein [Novosphingobium sp. 9]
MSIGAEIPFRRKHFARETGSLLLDRQRQDHVREAEREANKTPVWTGTRFLAS